MLGSPRTDRHWKLTLLGLAIVALFLLLHPYRGLVHDSRLYSFQALSHLHPELYGSDIFIQHGSQDDYTLFSPLFARTISGLGVEPAAALITLCTLALFFAAAWLLARNLLPATQAMLAMLLLVLVPTYYGPSRIFHVIEEFATPRQLAEALTLLCLVAWLRGSRILAAVLAGAAMLVHPIIGAMGAAFVPVFEWIAPRWRRLWPLAVLALLLVGAAAAGWLPIARWQFDPEWYRIVMHRTYLGLRNWNSEDWARILAVLTTLAVAGIGLRDRLRQVAIAGLITSGSLLLAAAAGGDLLRLVIVVQAQPWRALWLATVLAILLLPPLFVHGWRAAPLVRCSLLLLTAAWLSPQATAALVCAPLSLIAMALAARPIPDRQAALLLGGSWAAMLTAAVHAVATALLTWNEGLVQLESLPPMLDRLLTLSQGGVIPGLAILVCAWLLWRFPSQPTRLGLASLAIAAVAMLAVPHAGTWTSTRYDDSLRAAYQGWRDRIPPHSNVLWTSEETLWGDGAVNTWLLLERPSFVSGTQAPNALFSRTAAIEMNARASQLWGLVPFTDPFRPKGANHSEPQEPLRLTALCQSSSVRYVVTQADVVDATPIPAPPAAPPILRDFKLYICT